MTTLMLAIPWVTTDGLQFVGRAGGGASNCATWTAKPFPANWHHSWIVHIVMSSEGSRLVNEKSPQRCGLLPSVGLYADELAVYKAGVPIVPAASPTSLPVVAALRK